jgi:hypothetical protein
VAAEKNLKELGSGALLPWIFPTLLVRLGFCSGSREVLERASLPMIAITTGPGFCGGIRLRPTCHIGMWSLFGVATQ